MTVNSAGAVNAYASAARLLGQAGQRQKPTGALADPGGFTDLVKAAIEGTTQAGKAAEAKAADLASGKTDVVDLVTAVAETELAIESLVTVRDRVVSAYQDILNMPI